MQETYLMGHAIGLMIKWDNAPIGQNKILHSGGRRSDSVVGIYSVAKLSLHDMHTKATL